MRLRRAVIENYRAITRLELDLHPQLNVFFGGNAKGKTTVLNAIAVGLGGILKVIPEVSAIGFRPTDRRGEEPVRVELEAMDGTKWERAVGGPRRTGRLEALKNHLERFIAVGRWKDLAVDIPILAFYDTERAIREQPLDRRRVTDETPRHEALEGALSAGADFYEFLRWFRAREHEELGLRNERKDFSFEVPALRAVRAAVRTMAPRITDFRIAFRPLRFEVCWKDDGNPVERLRLSQLSGGYRVMLLLAADLARRMAQGNPHLDDPLQSEAIVLIDEVELHLYPSWQQTILPDLMRTFPNAQFLVSTHSPQVLTTVEADRVFELERENGAIGACRVPTATYGARASDALHLVMGVDERPANNPFVKDLRRYLRLVAEYDGETEAARALRQKLAEIAPGDPDLRRAALEIQRQRAFGLLREAK